MIFVDLARDINTWVLDFFARGLAKCKFGGVIGLDILHILPLNLCFVSPFDLLIPTNYGLFLFVGEEIPCRKYVIKRWN